MSRALNAPSENFSEWNFRILQFGITGVISRRGCGCWRLVAIPILDTLVTAIGLEGNLCLGDGNHVGVGGSLMDCMLDYQLAGSTKDLVQVELLGFIFREVTAPPGTQVLAKGGLLVDGCRISLEHQERHSLVRHLLLNLPHHVQLVFRTIHSINHPKVHDVHAYCIVDTFRGWGEVAFVFDSHFIFFRYVVCVLFVSVLLVPVLSHRLATVSIVKVKKSENSFWLNKAWVCHTPQWAYPMVDRAGDDRFRVCISGLP